MDFNHLMIDIFHNDDFFIVLRVEAETKNFLRPKQNHDKLSARITTTNFSILKTIRKTDIKIIEKEQKLFTRDTTKQPQTQSPSYHFIIQSLCSGKIIRSHHRIHCRKHINWNSRHIHINRHIRWCWCSITNINIIK